MAKKTKSKAKGSCRMLPVMHPDAAGVDIGAEEIFVAVPADRDVESVRSFDTFTRDLHQLADWLQSCRVRTVAMESTGVYWIPLPIQPVSGSDRSPALARWSQQRT
jgi:transposase